MGTHHAVDGLMRQRKQRRSHPQENVCTVSQESVGQTMHQNLLRAIVIFCNATMGAYCCLSRAFPGSRDSKRTF
jgi:hypothetical protein